MSEPFIAEVKIFAGNFAIRGWAFCNGQLLPINQNTALFSLLGTTFGGNGRTDFGLPDLRGRAPMGVGQGAGLNNRRWGEGSGEQQVTLATSQIPSHNHTLQANDGGTVSADPSQRQLSAAPEAAAYATGNASLTPLTPALSSAGGGQAHNNMQPYLGLNFLIALTGVFPSRS